MLKEGETEFKIGPVWTFSGTAQSCDAVQLWWEPQ